MSGFQIFLYIGGIVLRDLKGCIQLGIDYKLPLHPMHIGPFCGQEDPMGLDATISRIH